MEKKLEIYSVMRSNGSKIDKAVLAINNCATKNQMQKALIGFIGEHHDLSVKEFSQLYNKVVTMKGLNSHNYPNWDEFWGINNTSSWQKTLAELRRYAFITLVYEVNQKKSVDEKQQHLSWAKSLPVFKEHRHNFLFTGAWGRTNTVADIEEREAKQTPNSGPTK